MSCQSLREAIVDVARGTETGAGTRGTVECHVEHCASCRLLMARERQLSSGLRALAAASPGGAPEAMERRLIEAFARRRDAERQRRSAWSSALWVPAALVVVAGGLAVSWAVAQRQRVPEPAKPAPVVAARETQQPVQALPVAAANPQRALSASRPRPPASTSTSTPRPSDSVRPAAFVTLPSAVGLPELESGEIFRMQIPLTSLPAYGIEIAPDARGTAVEADLLVGQDGRPRAIRLVVASQP